MRRDGLKLRMPMTWPNWPVLGPLREYFTYHGVWSPGVRMLRSLTIRTKVLLVMGILAAPMLPLAVFVVLGQNQEVKVNGQRLAGMELAAAASALRAELGAPALAFEGGQARPPDGRAEADARLRAAYATALDRDLDLRQTWERGRVDVARAVEAPRNGPAPTTPGLQAALHALQELRNQAVYDSAVLSNDDRPLQAASDLALDALPSLQTALALLRRAVHQGLAEPRSSEAERHDVALRQAMALADVKRLQQQAMQQVALLPGSSAFDLKAVRAYAARIEREVLPLGASPDVAQLKQAYAQARSEVQEQRTTLLRQVGERLRDNQAHAEAVRTRVFAALAVAVLLSAYLTYCFFLVMRGGVKQLQHQAQRIADGDLSGRLNPLGHDEVATTMKSMSAALARLSDLMGSVRQGVGAVKQASESVATGNRDIAQRTQATTQGVASVLQGVQTNADQLAACGRQVEQVVALVQALRLESARNRKQMQRLRERMTSLRGKSREIGEIVRLIDNVAFRTNILALNASVEASKAGEAGRGFAVVAQEVRSLALRGADAARRIGDIVGRSTEDIELSGALAEETGAALAKADEHVDSIHTAMDDVTRLTTAGREESGRILDQLQSIRSEAEQGLHRVRQLAEASGALRAQGETLAYKVGQFRLS